MDSFLRVDRVRTSAAYLLSAFFFLVSMIAHARQVEARGLATSNFDSLAFLSTAIVEADLLGPPHQSQGLAFAYHDDAKITCVYKGDLAVGQTIHIAGLDLYGIPAPIALALAGKPTRIKFDRIPPGAHLVLFLTERDGGDDVGLSPDKRCYCPVSSGVKWLLNGAYAGFSLWSIPGAYELWGNSPKTDIQPEEIGPAIREAMKTVAPWEPVLKGQAYLDYVPTLLSILRARAGVRQDHKRDFMFRDAVSDAACKALASLHNFDAIADGLVILQDWQLTMALSNHQGCDFLMNVVRDGKQTMARRLACSVALSVSGYLSASMSPEENKDIGASLLNLALEVHESGPLAASVLDAADAVATHKDSFRDKKVLSGITDGLDAIASLYRSSSSEPIRFSIERLFLDASGEATYRTLHSECGNYISLVQAPDEPSQPRQLTYKAYAHSIGGKLDDADIELVLEDTQTKVCRVLPVGTYIDRWYDSATSVWTAATPLPAELPHGSYRVYLQFKRAGTLVSTGHFWELTL